MREELIGSGNSLNILKTDAGVHYVDADVHFKIKFGRQIVAKLHSEGQNLQDHTVLLHTPRPRNGRPRPFPKILTMSSLEAPRTTAFPTIMNKYHSVQITLQHAT